VSPARRVAALISRLQNKTGAVLTVSPDRGAWKMRLTLSWPSPGTYNVTYGGCDLGSLERALRQELTVFRYFRRAS
jgi:hypothetical protein